MTINKNNSPVAPLLLNIIIELLFAVGLIWASSSVIITTDVTAAPWATALFYGLFSVGVFGLLSAVHSWLKTGPKFLQTSGYFIIAVGIFLIPALLILITK